MNFFENWSDYGENAASWLGCFATDTNGKQAALHNGAAKKRLVHKNALDAFSKQLAAQPRGGAAIGACDLIRAQRLLLEYGGKRATADQRRAASRAVQRDRSPA